MTGHGKYTSCLWKMVMTGGWCKWHWYYPHYMFCWITIEWAQLHRIVVLGEIIAVRKCQGPCIDGYMDMEPLLVVPLPTVLVVLLLNPTWSYLLCQPATDRGSLGQWSGARSEQQRVPSVWSGQWGTCLKLQRAGHWNYLPPSIGVQSFESYESLYAKALLSKVEWSVFLRCGSNSYEIQQGPLGHQLRSPLPGPGL